MTHSRVETLLIQRKCFLSEEMNLLNIYFTVFCKIVILKEKHLKQKQCAFVNFMTSVCLRTNKCVATTMLLK